MEQEAKSYNQIRVEFYKKYKHNIVPTVQKYEKERKNKLLLAIAISSILVILASLLVYYICINGGIIKQNEGLLKLAFILYACAFIAWYSIKKEFENKIKKKIMPTVCKCFGDMKWSNGSYGNGKLFMDSGVVPRFSSEDYDDIFIGNYKNVHIEIVEPDFVVGSGKNRRTVFDGVIVKLDMNKEFTSHTVIKPNSLINISPIKELNHTEFEDVEFNKKFDVYTNDEVDARYLITTSFMERLKNMKIAFKANNVSCAFYGKLLIIALPTGKDIFSICSLIKKIDDREQYFQMYEEIESIIKLIDYFKMNQKIGL